MPSRVVAVAAVGMVVVLEVNPVEAVAVDPLM
jgi:hypothetical protein